MPIYEYVCGKCGKKTEVIQRVNQARLKVCPHCGGKLTKAFSAPAIQFKGSGWYVTDYARAKSEGQGGKSEKEKAGGESSASGASEKSDKSEKAGESASKPDKSEKAEKKKPRGSDG